MIARVLCIAIVWNVIRKNFQNKEVVVLKEKKTARKTKVNAKTSMAIESYISKLASKLPDEQMQLWVEAYLHPDKVIDTQKKNTTIKNTIWHLLFAGFISGIIMMIALWVFSFFNKGEQLTMLRTVSLLIAYPIMVVIAYFCISIIGFFVAKLFSGKGKFTEQTFGIALVYGGAVLITAPFSIFAKLPIIDVLMYSIVLVIQIGALYDYYLVMKHTHKLSSLNATFVMIVSVALVILAGLGVIAKLS